MVSITGVILLNGMVGVYECGLWKPLDVVIDFQSVFKNF